MTVNDHSPESDLTKCMERIKLLESTGGQELHAILNHLEKQNKWMNREEAFARLLFELAKERRPRSGG